MYQDPGELNYSAHLVDESAVCVLRDGIPTVVISDSNRMATQLLNNALLSEMCGRIEIKACVTHSEDVVEQVRAHSPSVTLVSASLEDGRVAGFRALKQLHNRFPSTRTIMLLDGRDCEQVVDAFRGGAKGVFYRTDPFDCLCKAIWNVHHGQIWAKSDDLECTLEAFTNSSPLSLVNAKGVDILSKREEQVVALVVEGLSNREISDRLHLSQNTVKNYMFRIFDKVGVSSRVELILYALSQKQPTVGRRFELVEYPAA